MEIELPNGQMAEFPDDMPHEDIEKVLQQHFSVQKSDEKKPSTSEMGYSPKGFSGIGRDVVESALTAPGEVIKGVMNLPGHIKAGGKYINKEPWYKGVGQLGIGGAEGIAGLLSAPQVGARYLADKFSDSNGVISKSLHETPTPYELMQEYEKGFGVDATKEGESELRALGQLLLAKKGLTKVPSKSGRIGLVTSSVGGQGGDPVHAALGSFIAEHALRSGKDYSKKIPDWVHEIGEKSELEKKIIESNADLASKESSLKTAQAEAGSASPEALKVKSENIKNEMNSINQELNKITPEYQKKGIDTSKMISDLSHEETLKNTSDLAKRTENLINESHEAQAIQLGKGQNFVERASPLITEGVKNIKNEITPLYTSVDEDLRNENVLIPNTEKSTQAINEMNRLINIGFINPESDAIYNSILEQLKKQMIGDDFSAIPAADFVNMYKSTRDLAYIAKKRSRQTGIPQDQRQRWENQAKVLEPIAKQQKELLKDSIPEETFDNLMIADTLWRKNVIPFYNNSEYRRVLKEGRTSDNIIKSTRGDNESNKAMQNLIQSNPELNRIALGQIYSEKPHELLSYNEMTEPYIEAHEPTKRLIEVQKRSINTNQKAQDAYNAAQERANEAKGKQKEEFEKIQKNEQQITKLENNIEKLTNDFERNEKNIKKLEDEIKKYGASKERNEKLKQYKKEKENIKSKIWSVASSGLGYLIGQNVIGSIFKMLFK